MNPSKVYTITFTDWLESVTKLLDIAELSQNIPAGKPIIIKPNLVEAIPPPVTTPVKLVAAIVDYLKDKLPGHRIIIGEGCGAMDYETRHAFDRLGYTSMAARQGVELLDLNELPLRRKTIPDCTRWPEMYLPELVYDSFLFSVPMLKVHTLAGVTLTMKNMMGAAPPSHYRQGRQWKKSAFHRQVQDAIFDLNRYRTPDFTLLDATKGMSQAHLWGPICDPPPNLLAAGYDPVAIDAYGTELLGKHWSKIGHISKAHNTLGCAEPITLIKVE